MKKDAAQVVEYEFHPSDWNSTCDYYVVVYASGRKRRVKEYKDLPFVCTDNSPYKGYEWQHELKYDEDNKPYHLYKKVDIERGL